LGSGIATQKKAILGDLYMELILVQVLATPPADEMVSERTENL
jgi:hypothetical protein